MVKTSSRSVFHKKKISKSLVKQVMRAARSSYAPYSRINVSAGMLCSSGILYTGVNIENGSYGLSMCAERVAIYNALSAGERSFKMILVYSPQIEHISPCGACLQVIGEFSTDIIIVTINDKLELKILPYSTLLKRPFKHPVLRPPGK